MSRDWSQQDTATARRMKRERDELGGLAVLVVMMVILVIGLLFTWAVNR